MKIQHFFLMLIIVVVACCKEKSGQHSAIQEALTVQNLDNQEVSVDSINSFVRQKMAAMDIPGVSYAIINKERLVFHNTLGYANLETKEPVKSETIFEGASTSKPVFASMVLLLAEDGVLDLDTPLYTYLNENQ